MTLRAREVVLALDQGSSSSRAIAFDAAGRVVARAQRAVRTKRPRDGWVEHDPRELAVSLERVLDEVLAKLPVRTTVLCAGLACQRSTVVFFDRRTLKPFAPAPSWMDGRAAQLIGPLAARGDEVHRLTGLYLTPYYSAPKIRWFLDHHSDVRDAARAGRLMAAPVSTYLIARLTQGEVLAADPTTAQRMLLLNLDSLTWDGAMLDLFAIERALLPELRPTMGQWGTLVRGGRRIPITASVGDQQAAAYGLGARGVGEAVANYGTGAFLLLNMGSDTRRVPGLLSSTGWNAMNGSRFSFLEGTVHAAGTSFEWLKGLGLMRDASRIDEAFKASRQRVFALPAIGGLGAPRWDYRTRTAWFGLTARTTPADLVRATGEGLCFLIAEIAAAMRRGGATFERARVAGGLARAAELMSFQADLLGVPLERRREGEATALGAAAMAAEAAQHAWSAGMTNSRLERIFQPRLDQSAAELLLREWKTFADAQAALSRELSAA